MQDVDSELEKYEPKVMTLLDEGKQLVERTPESSAQLLEQNLKNLEARWENIIARANDRKVRILCVKRQYFDFELVCH